MSKRNKKIKFVLRREMPQHIAEPVSRVEQVEVAPIVIQQASNSPRQLGLFDPSAAPMTLPTPLEEVSLDDPATALRSIARGFRLSFSWIPGMSQTLSGAEKHEWLSTALTAEQKRAASVKKNIYAPHKAISRLGSAKNKVKNWFQDRTNPFPEKAVRIFLVEPHPTPTKCTTGDLERYEAAQVAAFRTDFQNYINTVFNSAVENLQENWPGVIAAAKEMLQDKFDAQDYVQAENIPHYVRCWFEPVNLDLSKEWNFLTHAEQLRELELIQQKYKLAVAKQEEYVVGLLLDSLQHMAEALSKMESHSSKGKAKFYKSYVSRLFSALEEFKTKTVRYGILRGSNVERIFNEVNNMLNIGGREQDEDNVASIIRRNIYQRSRFTAAVEQAKNELTTLIAEGAVRRKIVTSI
jgi:hypothetical protein